MSICASLVRNANDAVHHLTSILIKIELKKDDANLQIKNKKDACSKNTVLTLERH